MSTEKKRLFISLSPYTEKNLDLICKMLGGSKSNAISYAINSFVMEKLNSEFLSDQKKS